MCLARFPSTEAMEVGSRGLLLLLCVTWSTGEGDDYFAYASSLRVSPKTDPGVLCKEGSPSQLPSFGKTLEKIWACNLSGYASFGIQDNRSSLIQTVLKGWRVC